MTSQGQTLYTVPRQRSSRFVVLGMLGALALAVLAIGVFMFNFHARVGAIGVMKNAAYEVEWMVVLGFGPDSGYEVIRVTNRQTGEVEEAETGESVSNVWIDLDGHLVLERCASARLFSMPSEIAGMAVRLRSLPDETCRSRSGTFDHFVWPLPGSVKRVDVDPVR